MKGRKHEVCMLRGFDSVRDVHSVTEDEDKCSDVSSLASESQATSHEGRGAQYYNTPPSSPPASSTGSNTSSISERSVLSLLAPSIPTYIRSPVWNQGPPPIPPKGEFHYVNRNFTRPYADQSTPSADEAGSDVSTEPASSVVTAKVEKKDINWREPTPTPSALQFQLREGTPGPSYSQVGRGSTVLGGDPNVVPFCPMSVSHGCVSENEPRTPQAFLRRLLELIELLSFYVVHQVELAVHCMSMMKRLDACCICLIILGFGFGFLVAAVAVAMHITIHYL